MPTAIFMPILKQAKKAMRNSARKRVFNLRRTRTMKDSIKEIRDAVAAGKGKDAQAKLSAAYKAIDKALKRGVIKKNTAARKKSRLARLIKKSK
jgi:small subunit ribosomal protein S20